LTPGTPVASDLTPANETDLYRFTATAGSKFFFDAQARSGATAAQWRLIDPFGGQVFSTGFTASTSDVDTLTLAQAGAYTLLIEGAIANTGASTYTFNVQPQAVGTTPLALGVTMSDAI